MHQHIDGPHWSRHRSHIWRANALKWLSVMALPFGLGMDGAVAADSAEPFKLTNIHFETNASACDMGIQIIFDTDGITTGAVFNPSDRKIYGFTTSGGMRTIGGQTEGFLEGVEPQITELLSALGCEPSDEEPAISIRELFRAFPAGTYGFEGSGKGVNFEDEAVLTHRIPAGPQIVAPANGAVVPDAALRIDWNPVTTAILTSNPYLRSVVIVGYHVIVVEAGAEGLPQLDIDVPATETSLTVPAQYLKPNTIYEFEVLATEQGGNQTISEGFFCTAGVGACVLP